MLALRVETFRRAALEVVVIALGVFAALAVDNWNEARKERQLEIDFLDGIALDLEINAREIARSTDQAATNKASLLRIIDAIATGVPSTSEPEDFILDMIRATYLGLPNLSSITFDELRSSGSMRILSNASFKRDLAIYYRHFEYASQFHPEYRRKEAQLEEALLGLLPLEERLEISRTNNLASTRLEPALIIETLQARPDLIARLEDMVWVQERIQTRYKWVIDDSQELLDAIAAMQ